MHIRPLWIVALLATACASGPDPEPAGAPRWFTGLGDLHHAIATRSPEAQRWFDQGLRLVYAFMHDEARRAFAECQRLDPECAMAYWGIAYTHGPNINAPRDPAEEQKALAALARGQALAAAANERDRAYLEALAVRHANDPKADGKALDAAFATAMLALAARFPDDLDAQTLAAEAQMNLRPWDLWTRSGEPHPGTLAIRDQLEAVLARDPRHIGALHYHIHATEASPDPGRGLHLSAQLAELAPDAAHLVHMPSHLTMRLGRYAEVIRSNQAAVAADARYLQGRKAEGAYAMYAAHNAHFLYAGAWQSGRSELALDAARQVGELISYDMAQAMPMLEGFTPTWFFALARFGRWQQILAAPPPPAGLRYTTAIWRHARGLAYLGHGSVREAEQELVALTPLLPEIPDETIPGVNSQRRLAELARLTLRARIEERRGDSPAALATLREAVTLEDQLVYEEPPPWYHPARQMLGRALLAAGDAAGAASAFRADLEHHPENGWSLHGLARALRAQGQAVAAAAVEARFRTAWAAADFDLEQMRY